MSTASTVIMVTHEQDIAALREGETLLCGMG